MAAWDLNKARELELELEPHKPARSIRRLRL